MTREEAIQWLKTVEVLGFDEKADWIQDALDMAIEALEENESLAKSLNDAAELIHKLQKKNEWVSCSERFPEPHKAVLAYAPKYNNIWAVVRTPSDKWMMWVPGITNEYNDGFYGELVKWMPLPSPPHIGDKE